MLPEPTMETRILLKRYYLALCMLYNLLHTVEKYPTHFLEPEKDPRLSQILHPKEWNTLIRQVSNNTFQYSM